VIHHKKDIAKLSQRIEDEMFDIFDSIPDLNVMLRDYIVSINDTITDAMLKQYQYDFGKFDEKKFKSKILTRVNHLQKDIDFVTVSENCFEKISDKVIHNIRNYIRDLKDIKHLENGKQRLEFQDLTLKLTNQITLHSIDIYRNYKQTA
jgi:hypothetical protein